MPQDLSVTRETGASAEQVWAMVSDVTRMGEWSPENEGAVWLGGATGPHPGARFQGTNRNGQRTWQTVGTVVDAENGRRFSFHVEVLGLKVTEWGYTSEPTATGCRVTETWIDQRSPGGIELGRSVTGVEDHASPNHAEMTHTLERPAAVAQSPIEQQRYSHSH